MVEALAVILFLPIMLGTAMGYCIVRLFVWAWPSLWSITRPGGYAKMREMQGDIMKWAPGHARWRAWFYAFEGARHNR